MSAGMRDFIDIYTFATAEEFEAVCALVVDSEREAGRRAQLFDLGTPADQNLVLL